ncbi:MAG: FlgD immunoglobulin-like domain containing protein [candidate division WOR-3 bacterium]
MRSLLLAALFIVASASADTLLVQDFDTIWSTNSPPGGWQIVHFDTFQRVNDWHPVDSFAPPWNTHPTMYAGIWYDPRVDSTLDIIMTPPINASGFRGLAIICSTYFSHRGPNPYTAEIRYSTDGGVTFPHLVRSYYGQNVGPAIESLPLGSGANNQTNLVIAWIFDGSLLDINWWAFDDVAVVAEPIVAYDIRCAAIREPDPYELPGTLTPAARFRNAGLMDQYDIPVFCNLYDSTGTLLQAWSDTIDTLLSLSGERVKFFSPPFNIDTGHFSIEFYCAADSDYVRSNDTLRRDFIVSSIEMLANDDGSPSGYLSWPLGTYGWSARFAPTGSFYIESLQVYLNSPTPVKQRRYQLAIARDNSGTPGEFVFLTPIQFASPGTGWNSVYIGARGDEIQPGSPFHVVYLQVGEPPECPALGQDGNLDSTNAYHEYLSGTYQPTSPPGDLMIRVFINRQSINPQPPYDVRTVFVETPGYEVWHRPYNASVPISARVHNFGFGDLSDVVVACTIFGTMAPVYTSTTTVATLPAGSEATVAFADPWYPVFSDEYKIIVTASTNPLQPDPIPDNNRKKFDCEILKGAYTGSSGDLAWIDSDTIGGPVFNWIEPDTNNVLIASGPDARIYAPFYFDFPWGDTTYANAYVCDNGWLSLGHQPGTYAPNPDTIPSTAQPNAAFFAWWRDLGFGPAYGGGRVYWQVMGQSPNRKYVVTWYNGRVFGADTANKVTFQMILNENGTVVFQYLDVFCGSLEYNRARYASIGVENRDGTVGANYLYAVPPLSKGRNNPQNRLSAGRAIKFFRRFRDAAALDIKVPALYVFPESIRPRVQIQNYGTVGDSIWTFLSIVPGTYRDSVLVVGLPAGADTLIDFSTSWRADSGTYVAVCSVAMDGDERQGNNVVSRVFSVSPWVQRPDIEAGWYRRRVKNATLAYAPTTGKLYAMKGSNTNELWSYDIATGKWESLASMPLAPSNSKAKDGNDITFDPYGGAKGRLWAIKGGGRTDFYSYDIATNTWTIRPSLRAPVNLFRAPKKGAALAYVPTVGDSGSVYCIPGNNSLFFYRYNISDSTWDTCPSVPIKVVNPRPCKFGSDLVFDGDTAIWLLKGTNTTEIWPFNPLTNRWGEMLDDVSLLGPRSKRVKAGGSITYLNGHLYVLKGGNTLEFWDYAFARNDSWHQRPDIPIAWGGRRIKVKRGSAMAATDSAIFCLKGSYSYEFWEYRPGTDPRTFSVSQPPERSGVMSERTTTAESWLRLNANPARGGVRIAFGLSAAGNARLRIYDASGILVRTLVDAPLSAGQHWTVWDGRIPGNRTAAAGVYFVKLEVGDRTLGQKLILQR